VSRLSSLTFPIVQISLDLTNIDEALDTAAIAVEAGVDWLEAGTPLLLAEGLHAVEKLRAQFPNHPIVADLKTMDGGYLEAEMMAKAGASYVVVMGRAHEATVRRVVDAAKKYDIGVMGDNLAAEDRIANAVSKNFKTRGAFVIEPKGNVFNTEAVVGEAVIKGRFLGKLIAERLTIHSTAEIKGSFNAAHLIIPAEDHFHWKEQIKVGSAEIAGELVASLHATGTIILKSTARLFGDAEVKNFVVEDGAVVVGYVRAG